MGIQRPVKGETAPPSGWMDQQSTWYEGRPGPRLHCVKWYHGDPAFLIPAQNESGEYIWRVRGNPGFLKIVSLWKRE